MGGGSILVQPLCHPGGKHRLCLGTRCQSGTWLRNFIRLMLHGFPIPPLDQYCGSAPSRRVARLLTQLGSYPTYPGTCWLGGSASQPSWVGTSAMLGTPFGQKQSLRHSGNEVGERTIRRPLSTRFAACRMKRPNGLVTAASVLA